MIDMATPSSTDTINADELPSREKTHIDGGPIGIAVLDDDQHAPMTAQRCSINDLPSGKNRTKLK
jgi:hypothetical protein